MSDSNLSIRCELVESWRLIRAVAPRVVRLAGIMAVRSARSLWRYATIDVDRGRRGWQ